MKKYPLQKDLESMPSYRFAKILKWTVLVLAVIAPIFTGGIWYFDGVINAGVWYVLFLILGVIIKYILFGKAPDTKEKDEENEEKYFKIVPTLILIILYLFIVYIILKEDYTLLDSVYLELFGIY